MKKIYSFVLFLCFPQSFIPNQSINAGCVCLCGESKILFQFINPINVRLSGRDIDCGVLVICLMKFFLSLIYFLLPYPVRTRIIESAVFVEFYGR